VDTALDRNFLVAMREDSQPAVVDIDVELMLGFQAGDLQAFETLFSRHARSVVNFAYRFVRNREIAEELAQEIFLKVHDAAPKYRVEAKFTTWLFRIATNVCLNEIRRPYFRASHQSLDTLLPDDCEGRPVELEDTERPGPHAVMERRAIAAALKQALDQLPEKQRLAFILNKYQDFSYAAVAEIMKVSEKAVKSLIHRAKEAMAERLKAVSPELL
jgi:RNA polymerase sigma-70 factor (ECF subfamily)